MSKSRNIESSKLQSKKTKLHLYPDRRFYFCFQTMVCRGLIAPQEVSYSSKLHLVHLARKLSSKYPAKNSKGDIKNDKSIHTVQTLELASQSMQKHLDLRILDFYFIYCVNFAAAKDSVIRVSTLGARQAVSLWKTGSDKYLFPQLFTF